MSCDDVVAVSGRILLFLGVETINWTLAQFDAAAQFARNYGIDSLLVKVGDGLREWYDEWDGIVDTVHKAGCGIIPYWYMYGDTAGSSLEKETEFLLKYMASNGIVCADIEAEFQNNPGWGTYIATMMKPAKGMFLVTTFADPNEISTSYGSLIHNISSCVDAFIPQEYDSYLALKWPDFGADGASCLLPAIDMTQEFGPNAVVSIVENAAQEGHRGIAIWEYSTALANKTLLAQAIAAFPKKPLTTEEKRMSQQAIDVWNSSAVPTQHLVIGSAIHAEWAKQYEAKVNYGPPSSPEYKLVDEKGNTFLRQNFAYGWADYVDGKVVFTGGLKLA